MSTRAEGVVSRATDAVTVAGFRVGWSLIRRMPERTAYALFDRIADLTVARGGAARMRENYATVRPELGPAELTLAATDLGARGGDDPLELAHRGASSRVRATKRSSSASHAPESMACSAACTPC